MGIHEYAVIETTFWMSPPTSSLSVVALHQDQVVEPPPAARILGGSEFCPYGMMSLGERVFTIQTHPEMNTDYASELFEARKAVYGEAVGDRALRMLDRGYDHALFAAWVAGFLGNCIIY